MDKSLEATPTFDALPYKRAAFATLGDALDLLDDGLWQRVGIFPQRVKFLLDPGDTFRRSVFP